MDPERAFLLYLPGPLGEGNALGPDAEIAGAGMPSRSSLPERKPQIKGLRIMKSAVNPLGAGKMLFSDSRVKSEYSL
jgi:hypothetical protein